MIKYNPYNSYYIDITLILYPMPYKYNGTK